MAQIRQNVTEYGILPLGSLEVRKKVFAAAQLHSMPGVRSLLLYGPAGTGKTTIAEAIAHHTGRRRAVHCGCMQSYYLDCFPLSPLSFFFLVELFIGRCRRRCRLRRHFLQFIRSQCGRQIHRKGRQR